MVAEEEEEVVEKEDGLSGRGSQKTTPSAGKYKGGCAKLSCYVSDCSDYR